VDVQTLERWRHANHSIKQAEDRLWLLLPSAIINPVGLILFGVGSNNGWRWPVPYVGLGFIGFGWGCAGDLSMAYLMDAYPEMVLEGMVGVAVINNSLACIFTFVCSKYFVFWLRRAQLIRSRLLDQCRWVSGYFYCDRSAVLHFPDVDTAYD
jgi:hypothetical protein